MVTAKRYELRMPKHDRLARVAEQRGSKMTSRYVKETLAQAGGRMPESRRKALLVAKGKEEGQTPATSCQSTSSWISTRW